MSNVQYAMCNMQYVQSPDWALLIAYCSFSILGRQHALVQGFNARSFSANSLPSEGRGNSRQWHLNFSAKRKLEYSFINSHMLEFNRNLLVAVALFALTSCDKRSGASLNAGGDAQVKSLGTVEVSARLVEIPDGAIFQRDLYDYATILKYEVVSVHRGPLEKGTTIYVGHYNPWKPRAESADKRAKNIGGTLRQFKAGQLHRLALETPMDDYFMGGIVDKYFGQHTGPVYWAVWTNAAD
jgi:hypothetical protein